jgi:hypothetical protein
VAFDDQSRFARSVGFGFEDIASSGLVLTAFTHDRRSLWPSASRSILTSRLYNFLSQVISSCAFYRIGKKAWCIQPRRLEVTAGEGDETEYQHGINGDCITEDNCK